jgi:myosin heavy subunit
MNKPLANIPGYSSLSEIKVRQQLLEKETDLNHKKQSIAKINKTNKELRATIDQLETEATDSNFCPLIPDQTQVKQLERLRKEIIDLKTLNSKSMIENNGQDTQMRRQREKLNALESRNLTLQSQFSEKDHEISQQKAQITTLNNKALWLTFENSTLKENQTKLENTRRLNALEKIEVTKYNSTNNFLGMCQLRLVAG